MRHFRQGGCGTKLTLWEAHGEDERGKEDRGTAKRAKGKLEKGARGRQTFAVVLSKTVCYDEMLEHGQTKAMVETVNKNLRCGNN